MYRDYLEVFYGSFQGSIFKFRYYFKIMEYISLKMYRVGEKVKWLRGVFFVEEVQFSIYLFFIVFFLGILCFLGFLEIRYVFDIQVDIYVNEVEIFLYTKYYKLIYKGI